MKLAFWKRKKSKTEKDLTPPTKSIRVLMVDDEELFLRLTKRNLEAEGFVVQTENRASGALRAARSFKPDIILLDVMMPDGDGGEVAARIGNDPEVGHTPILFLTAAIKGSEVGGAGAAEIGGRFYIAKPVEAESLIEYIEAHAACSA